jgi:hypothetical protein
VTILLVRSGMAQHKPDPASLAAVDDALPRRGWRDPHVEFRKGT